MSLELISLLEGDFQHGNWLGAGLYANDMAVLVVNECPHNVGQLESSFSSVAM